MFFEYKKYNKIYINDMEEELNISKYTQAVIFIGIAMTIILVISFLCFIKKNNLATRLNDSIAELSLM
jgi:phosphotransferase system  glucose/maltose/N-acetylglucosamine-specific IIC component